MSSSNMLRKFQKELNAGAVSLVLLSVLEQRGEAMYGYEIARTLGGLAEGELPMNQAAIYPVLRSLEKQGLLRSRTLPSDAGPPRRYYQPTPAGRRALDEWKTIWRQTTRFVDAVLENRHERDTLPASRKIPRSART